MGKNNIVWIYCDCFSNGYPSKDCLDCYGSGIIGGHSIITIEGGN
jgi:hypothetical protein